jgi:hypothetical protein
MLGSGRDRLPRFAWSAEGEAGIGVGGVVGCRTAISSGDGGDGRRERDRGRGRAGGGAPVGAFVAGALSRGGLGGVGGSLASAAVVSARGVGGARGGGVRAAAGSPAVGALRILHELMRGPADPVEGHASDLARGVACPPGSRYALARRTNRGAAVCGALSLCASRIERGRSAARALTATRGSIGSKSVRLTVPSGSPDGA